MSLYFINYEISGYNGEIWFNGAPLNTCYGEFSKNAIQVNHWIIDGDNLVRFNIESLASGKQPEDHIPREGIESIEMALCEGPGDEAPGSGEYFEGANLRWPLPKSCSLPFALEVTGRIRSPFPTWRWQAAEVLRQDTNTLDSAAAYVAEIHRVLVAKEMQRLEQMADVIFEEVSLAFGADPVTSREEFRGFYSRLFADPDYRPAPLDPTEYAFRYCCGNRLLEIRNKGEVPTLRQFGYENDGGWFLPIFLGREKGRWEVLR
jgi:hypothetical protein